MPVNDYVYDSVYPIDWVVYLFWCLFASGVEIRDNEGKRILLKPAGYDSTRLPQVLRRLVAWWRPDLEDNVIFWNTVTHLLIMVDPSGGHPLNYFMRRIPQYMEHEQYFRAIFPPLSMVSEDFRFATDLQERLDREIVRETRVQIARDRDIARRQARQTGAVVSKMECFDQKKCAICLESILCGQIILRGQCCHIFHNKCMDQSIIKCPECRGLLHGRTRWNEDN